MKILCQISQQKNNFPGDAEFFIAHHGKTEGNPVSFVKQNAYLLKVTTDKAMTLVNVFFSVFSFIILS